MKAILKRIGALPLHPFFFALWPIFYWADYNFAFVVPDMLKVPACVSVAMTSVLLLVCVVLYRDFTKAAVITSTAVVLFFSFRFFADAFIECTKIQGHDSPQVITSYWTSCLVILLVLSLIRRYSRDVNTVFNIVSIALVLLNIVIFSGLEGIITNSNAALVASLAKEDRNIKLHRPAHPPDIYYIILDGMGRSDVFREHYGYDNSAFLQDLKKQGFYIGSKSRSNYAWTVLSTTSALSMDYVPFIPNDPVRTQQILTGMIEYNRVPRLLKTIGYTFVHCGSASDSMPQADINLYTGWGSWFNQVLLEYTAVRALPGHFDEPIMAEARSKRLWFFHNIEKVKALPSPKFVFVHVLMPHDPYLFHKDGKPVSMMHFALDDEDWANKQAYIEQAQFTESQAKIAARSLLEDKSNPPVVIFQGDHGPMCDMDPNFEDKPSFIQQRFPILNAYFLPQGAEKSLYNSISPVNSFRVIFNSYFGTNYSMLPDRNNYSHFLTPCLLNDVTDAINWDEQ